MMRIKGHVQRLILLSAAVAGLFANSLRNGFVWDDNVLVVGNKVYQGFDLGRMFFSLSNRLEYLPLRDLSFAVDFAVWGERAAGFHVTNLLLYLGNVVAIYFLARRIQQLLAGSSRPSDESAAGFIAFAAALLFAVHPIHCEVVDFIGCRNNLLSGLFFFLSCHFYLISLQDDARGRAGYWGALFFFLCALLSKATAIALPLVLLLFTAYAERKRGAKSSIRLAPFFALSLVFFVIFREVGVSAKLIDERLLKFTDSSIMAKGATALQIPFFYLGKLLVPAGLSAEYDTTFATSVTSPAVLAALTGVVILCMLSAAGRKRYPELLFCLGWFIATLAPVLNFFSTNPVVADRYAFLPSFGFCYLAATALGRFQAGNRRMLALCAVSLLVVCWSAVTITRNTVWKNDKVLWEATIKASPRLGKAYTNLGHIYFQEGNFEKAFALFARSEEINPAEDSYQLYQGYLYARKGDFTSAIALFKEAVQKNPDSLEALFNLGDLYEKTGNHEAALEFYAKTGMSMELDPKGYRETAARRVQALLREFAPQLDDMRRNVAADPRNLTLRGELALRLDSLGLYGEALENYHAMENLGMKDWKLFYNIANIYKKQRKYQEAARYYEESIALKPDYPDTYNNLGAVYKHMRRTGEAIAAFRKAMTVNERFAQAPFNLAITYFQEGDRDKARYYFRYIQERFPELAGMIAPYLKQLHM